MKFKKNYPKVSVLEHGGEYILPDFAPICPECGSEKCRLALNFGRETKGSWGHTGAIYSTRIYYKEYTCRNCECRFRIDEGRKIEVDWWVIFCDFAMCFGGCVRDCGGCYWEWVNFLSEA